MAQKPERPNTLTINYNGLVCVATSEMTFGRRAELILDAENRYLHGEAGRVRLRGGDWFLYNTGSTLHLHLHHGSGQHSELPPSTNAKMPVGQGWIRVSAGGTDYTLFYDLGRSDSVTVLESESSDTERYGAELSPSQIDYAVTLARYRLRGLRNAPPGHGEIARLWTVSQRTIGKTFEDIRTRLRTERVDGIETTEGLIEHLVVNRLVTLEHLESARLDDPSGPFRRAEVLRQRAERGPAGEHGT